MENEIWKSIPGYEGRYEVSSAGRVRSVDRVVVNYVKGKLLADSRDLDGYIQTGLSDLNGKVKNKKRHRIVVEAFLGSIPAGRQINHKNGIKDDNRIENLEICTPKENIIHSRVFGLNPMGLNQGHLTRSRSVDQYTLDGNFIATFTSIADAARQTKVGRAVINSAVVGRQLTAGGFIWKYTPNSASQ